MDSAIASIKPQPGNTGDVLESLKYLPQCLPLLKSPQIQLMLGSDIAPEAAHNLLNV